MDDDTLSNFTAITGTTTERAQQYLVLTDGNLEQAIELYFANDGADLEAGAATAPAQSSQAAPVPNPPTRPSRRQQGYEDATGVVHVDSERGSDASDDGSSQQAMAASATRQRGSHAASASQVPPTSTPSTSRAGPLEDDEAMARRLQQEIYGDAGVGEQTDAEGVRAPIARTTETLVGPGAYDMDDEDEMRAAVLEQMRARQQPRSRGTFPLYVFGPLLTVYLGRPGIFNQTAAGSIWTDADANADTSRSRLARATAGASEASSKSNMLAEMYRPPFEIMYKESWEDARRDGKDGEKWLLVNIQDPSIFDCQVLNRDIWKNPGIKETVDENFIFMQYSKDDPRGKQYIQYYFPGHVNEDSYPHIAILDPRTGEQLKIWSGLPAPKAPDFLMQLHEFLDRYSLKATAKNPVARRKPDARKETHVEKMTEEQMLEMALQNSLAPAESSRRDSDPDNLTRSVGHLESSNERPADEDLAMTDVQPEPAQANGSSNSPLASISSSRPHTEPPPEVASTRIQFRHPNGRVVRCFGLSEHVRRIYEWLKASPLEGKEGTDFELICMGKNLIDHLEETIEQAGLKNSSVMVEFLES